MAKTRKPRPIYKNITKRVLVGWQMQCSECLTLFQAKRSDASTCGDRCRMRRSHRLRKNAEQN